MQRHGAVVRLPLAGAVGHVQHLRDVPGRISDMAHVSEAVALARRPAFIDNRNMTRSRAGEQVVARYPRSARSWVRLTIVACVPCIVVLRLSRSPFLIR